MFIFIFFEFNGIKINKTGDIINIKIRITANNISFFFFFFLIFMLKNKKYFYI